MEDFLKELTILSKKYNITIGACGCCNSPWLNENDKQTKMEYFRYILSNKDSFDTTIEKPA